MLVFIANAEPVPVRRVQGYLHGFVVLKDMDDKILASGDLTQTPSGNRVTTILNLHFKDGSLYQETSVYSQRRTFQLLTYKQVQKGPSFKTPETLSLDTSTGKVNIQYTDKDGSAKTIDDTLSLPPDLANGILPTLLTQVDPKVETTLSMLVSTPKPRVVKLKIAASEPDSFTVGGVGCQSHSLRHQDRYWRRHRRSRQGGRQAAAADPFLGCRGQCAGFPEVRRAAL